MSGILKLAQRFFSPYKLYLIVGPLSKTLEVIFDLLTPLVIAWMIDAGIIAQQVKIIVIGGTALIVMALLGFGVTLICQKMASIASQAIGTSIRDALERKVQRTNILVLSSLGTNTLETRITNDVNQIQVMIAMLIRQVIRWPILAVGSVICALCIDLRLGFIFCVCLPLIALVFGWVMLKLVPQYHKLQTLLDGMARQLQETFAGFRTIRAFNRQSYEIQRFRNRTDAHAQAAIHAGRLNALLSPATFLIMNVGTVCILLFAVPLAQSQSIEAGQVIALISYMNQLLLAIAYVANLVVIFTRAETSSERVLEVLNLPDHADKGRNTSSLGRDTGFENATARDVGQGSAVLEVAHLSYTFAGAHEVALSDISFKLYKGKTLGIIGGTGSGKTTLINLISGLYEIQQGAIQLLGKDLQDYSHAERAASIALVPQYPALLSGTIRDNLVWRDAGATDEQLASALADAQADFVLDHKEGLSAEVLPQGKNFSGGQRQRLTIARALVGKNDVLILDDASSALDYETDAKLRAALTKRGDTMIVVSQRVSSVRHADEIAVLDRGHLVACAPHNELLKNCELYQEICASQMRDEELYA